MKKGSKVGQMLQTMSGLKNELKKKFLRMTINIEMEMKKEQVSRHLHQMQMNTMVEKLHGMTEYFKSSD